ncbi:soluble lytic murein transglycosylase precursor [Clostridium homopropionicum DSM 5847]|uniref:Soluble lytic murein transglycosylase n=1 Tax=Clostridium homopropionicum DSM 5847 TaxID=1121318 RepID=A0A0L6ZB08_9CLOT|nr:lytic transglycosylase domain-containing protein [Clostridium homopropionicum]KOA20159.1 soluble lytic murein transglycosylase precursor [Clostridium homopropionicum DSM 5847]SFG60906.1 soluble lytic murein transglycosylase [Clostridium homopropionicum]
MKKNRKKSMIFVLILTLLLVVLNLKNIVKTFYPLNYKEYIETYSNEYNLNPLFVAAVIKAESNFQVDAVSKRDARGLMQITPSTAKWAASKLRIDNFDINSLYDPELNIKIGCWYLNDLCKEFGTDTTVILAAYNGGRGNVNKWLSNKEYSKDGKKLDYIPFKETDQYVKKIEVNYNIYKFLYGQDGDYIKFLKLVFSKFLL